MEVFKLVDTLEVHTGTIISRKFYRMEIYQEQQTLTQREQKPCKWGYRLYDLTQVKSVSPVPITPLTYVSAGFDFVDENAARGDAIRIVETR